MKRVPQSISEQKTGYMARMKELYRRVKDSGGWKQVCLDPEDFLALCEIAFRPVFPQCQDRGWPYLAPAIEQFFEQIVKGKHPDAELRGYRHGKVQICSLSAGPLGDVMCQGTREQRRSDAWRDAAERVLRGENPS